MEHLSINLKLAREINESRNLLDKILQELREARAESQEILQLLKQLRKTNKGDK